VDRGKPRDTGDYSKIADMTALSENKLIPRLYLSSEGTEGICIRNGGNICYTLLCSLASNQYLRAFHPPVLSGVPLCCGLWRVM